MLYGVAGKAPSMVTADGYDAPWSSGQTAVVFVGSESTQPGWAAANGSSAARMATRTMLCIMERLADDKKRFNKDKSAEQGTKG